MAEIPTMECESCNGLGGFLTLVGRSIAGRRPCPHCNGAGRIPRPPLTPDEIAALPDGARVVARSSRGCHTMSMRIDDPVDRRFLALHARADTASVWLAEEAE